MIIGEAVGDCLDFGLGGVVEMAAAPKDFDTLESGAVNLGK